MPSGGRQAKLTEFGELRYPKEAVEPILAAPVRGAVLEWMVEIQSEAELKAIDLMPRRRALFGGPPGTGKTTLAHHLAARLGLPMLIVRPEKLIDCYLGSTGRNVGALFEMAADTEDPVMLFMDEFDALAMKRKAARSGAEDEQNAWINTLLQRIEQHPGFLIGATNFLEHIDPAIWRRFQVHITVELPGQGERRRILARYLAPFGLPAVAMNSLADAFETASPALIREFCEGLRRQLVVGPKLNLNMQREAVFERLLASIKPHPEAGKPRLWTHGAKDNAVRTCPWPLQLAKDIPAEERGVSNDDGGIISFPGKVGAA